LPLTQLLILKISRYEEESARAFSAAEAGIEEALKIRISS